MIATLAVVLNTTSSTAAADGKCTEGVFASRVVAMEGRQLEALVGQPVSQLRMWVYQEDEERPIPFQVDACDADGRLVVSALGERADDRPLGEQSVLLFAASDAGERRLGPLSAGVTEIEIVKPGDDASRWAYIGRADGTVALSRHDYVSYDPQTDTVNAERYTVRFPHGLVEFFCIADVAGHNTANLIDRWKIRVEARFLWGLLKFRRNEEDVAENVVGYTDGPIRVVRRSRLKTEVGRGISSPEGTADEYFYGDHYGGPNEIRIPFKLARLFGDVEVRIYLDFRNLRGFEVTAEGHGASVVGESSPSRAPAAVARGVSWFMMTNAELGFLHRLRLGATLDDVKSELFYVDGDQYVDPPEAVPGMRPGVGYRLTNWGNVGRGLHKIWTETYVIDPAKFTRPEAGLGLLSAPLGVIVHRIPSSLRYPPEGSIRQHPPNL